MNRYARTMYVAGIVLSMVVVGACAAPPMPSGILVQTAFPATNATLLESQTSIAPTSALPASTQNVNPKLDIYLKKLVNLKAFSGSVLVARNGSVLLSKGYGEADRENHIANTSATKFRLASITKQFTAMAILMLQAQGKLNVQDHICAYLSDCPMAWQEITIHQLLTHTSGIPDYTEFPDYSKLQGMPSPPEGVIARFKDKPLDFRPGENWRYSNSGYVLLGVIIEQVSGRSYEKFLDENILKPLNMRNTGYDHNELQLAVGYSQGQTKIPANFIDMSVLYAGGALYSTVEDLYLWDQALYSDKLLPKGLLEKMFTPFAQIPDSIGWGYGYGWLIGTEVNHTVVAHDGETNGFKNAIERYLDDRVVVIILGNQETMDSHGVGVQLAKLVFDDK